jgi:hypothetical protein
MTSESSTNESAAELIDRVFGRHSRYMRAVGEFVARFSEVEKRLQITLWELAGVPPPIAQAVFSGIRVEGAMQFINRIADAQQWEAPRKKTLQYLFSQLGKINRLRNDLLHYGSTNEIPDNLHWIITNKEFAHVPDRVFKIRITQEIIDNATYDLSKITLHLILFTWHGDDKPDAETVLAPILQASWRYKPPSRDRALRKSRSRPRTPPREPPPSRK